MRAIEIQQFGGPEVLAEVDRPAPKPGRGELVVDVAASGVNYMDTYQRTGVYPVPRPFVLGSEGAGRVSAVGPDVGSFAVGDRVAWAMVSGSYAEQVVVPADRAVPVPDEVDEELAAGALLQGMTAEYLVRSTYPVKEGDAVLLHAAAGGVGQLLTQVVKLHGGRVIATASTDEKARLARAAGADEVVPYADFTAAARDFTDGRGVDVVYDGVGQATFDGGLAALRPRGMMVLYGAASGQVPPFDLQRLNSGGSLYVTRPMLAHYIVTTAELRERAGHVFGWIRSGQLRLRIGGRYPLAEARRAHEDLEARRTTGKLILLPRG